MGAGSYSTQTYNHVSNSRSYSTKSAAQTFSSKLQDTMNPASFKNGMRECRDSDDHPYSVPVLVFLDVTGSMGHIPHELIKDKFPTLMETLISHKVEHAQICFGAIGDHFCDKVPLQMGQFEQETVKLADMLESVYLEGAGGGNGGESYGLAWYVAANHTSIDCFEKRGTKGFLFTIGDENIHLNYSGQAIKDIMGLTEAPTDMSAKQLYDAVSSKYNVFHIHVEDGSYQTDEVSSRWKELLGEHFLVLKDSNNVAELIATTVAVINGADMGAVLKGFSSSAAGDVSQALAKVGDLIPAVQSQEEMIKL